MKQTILLLLLLLSVSAIAESHFCLNPRLPKPTESPEEVRARFPDSDRTPPPDPQVGDTWDWWIWDLGGYPTATQLPCTVRGMGENIYIVVEDSQWNVNMDQADVDRIVDHFENQSLGEFPDQGIWDLNTSHFGFPPDSDGLSRVFFLYYEFNISADGYFWYFDQYPDNSQPFHSNEADVIYLATDSGNPSSDYMMAVGAHEFEHLIHFETDQNEDSWVDEGLGELAMWLFGRPDNISSFNSNPDNNLIDFAGNWSDYIQTYLWTLYAYEQFGGQPFIWELTHHYYNGMSGYQAAINNQGYSITTQDLFGDWSVANFLDEPEIYEGQYGYLGDELPTFYSFRTHNSYPVSSGGSVQDWGTDYVRLFELTGTPVLHFNGSNPHDFRVKMMALETGDPSRVISLELDADSDGSIEFPEAFGYNQVEISIASVTVAGTGTYSYTVEIAPTDAPDPLASPLAFSARPNPFNPKSLLHFEIPEAAVVRLSLHDAQGRLLETLADGHLDAGSHDYHWNASGRSSGLYFARLTVEGAAEETRKLVLLK